MSRWIGQVGTATRFALLSFRRNPAASFFTVVFPLLFMLLFGFIFGDAERDNGAIVATLQVPGIITMSVVGATFVNLAITTTFRRELGQLKRLRATPMPPSVYIAAQMAASFVIVVFMTVLLIVLGRVLFDVRYDLAATPVLALTLVLASAAFSALGLGITRLIPSQDAAPAVTNFIVLPLYFISDVFLFSDADTGVIGTIARIFPVKHLAEALQGAFDPFVTEVAIPWSNWLVIGVWGLVGAVVAALTFTWSPRRSA